MLYPHRPVLACLCCFLLLAARGEAVSLETVFQNGPRTEKINLVFFAEGYTQAQLPSFSTHVDAIVDHLFSQSPFTEYRSLFNVFKVPVVSNQSGADHPSNGIQVDTYFNSTFELNGIARLLGIQSEDKLYALLSQLCPEWDVPIVVVNDPEYGGAGGSYAVISTDPGYYPEILAHEIGHSLPDLGDEYSSDTPGYPLVEMPNITGETQREKIRWKKWIDDATPIPSLMAAATSDITPVGLYEGAQYTASGRYRPVPCSKMRELFKPYGAVNAEQFVISFYDRIRQRFPDLCSDFFPSQALISATNSSDLQFSVLPVVPGDCRVQWELDGQILASGTGLAFSRPSDFFSSGTHQFLVRVSDTTALVRNDPQQLLSGTHAWTLVVSNQPPGLTAPATVSGTLFESLSFSVATANPATSFQSSGLPEGISINPSTGECSGVPMESGTFNALITASNGFGDSSTQVLLAISDAGSLMAGKVEISGTIGSALNQSVPGAPGVVYAAAALPFGVVLDPATGLISGTPSSAGVFSTSITATKGLQVESHDLLFKIGFLGNGHSFLPAIFRGEACSLPGSVGGSVGLAQFSMTAQGAFTGKIQIGGRTLRLLGSLDQFGTASAIISDRVLGQLNVSLSLTESSEGHYALSGQLSNASVQITFAFPSNITPIQIIPYWIGLYTLLIEPVDLLDPDSHPIPQGTGYGTVRLWTNGALSFILRLGDGTRATLGTFLRDDSTSWIRLPIYSGKGLFSGTLAFSESAGVAQALGECQWRKPPSSLGRYREGFAAKTTLSANLYQRPYTSGFPLEPTGRSFDFQLDGQAGSIPYVFTTPTIARSSPGPSSPLGRTLYLHFQPSNGLFTGWFYDPGNVRRSFSGSMLQIHDQGGGLFLSGTKFGSVHF